MNQRRGTSTGLEMSQNNQTEISMNRLVLFQAYVIDCSKQAKTKIEKIKVIVKRDS